MLDGNSFQGTAAKEIKEETGLEFPESELINMTELALPTAAKEEEQLRPAVYPSAGGCNEFVPVFLWQKQVPREQLKQWEGKLTGLRDQGERITLMLTPLEDLWKTAARDAKALAGYALYKGLKEAGKI